MLGGKPLGNIVLGGKLLGNMVLGGKPLGNIVLGGKLLGNTVWRRRSICIRHSTFKAGRGT